MRDGKESDYLKLLKKKAKKCYEKVVFQDTWACQFPWTELIVGEDGLDF
jgi:hypothetical protein